MLHRISIICILLGMLGAQAEWTVETNSLRVKEPSTLQGDHDSAIGDFGIPLYGASIQGQLRHISDNDKGCTSFKVDDFKVDGASSIALVVRGDCYFVEKAYNAERAGAKAILVMDDRAEQLLTMAAPEDHPEIAKLREDITIPTALIQKELGQTLKDALATSEVPIIIELDWTESITHPDERVEWELWTSSNDGCGNSCDIQMRFKKEFRETAVKLEKAEDTLFTPHYMSRACTSGLESPDCKDNCIHYGRYCSMDSIPDQYVGHFKGWQVVEENKRQLCVFQQAKEMHKPWLWWDFVDGYGTNCTFANGKFNDVTCAQTQVEAIGLNNTQVLECLEYSFVDKAHPLLQADLEAQERDSWGAKILLLPTVIMNDNQYRGRLDTPSIVRALCSGFKESSEPDICLAGSLQPDECAAGTHNCWQDGDRTACLDTFRGFVCQCPGGFRGDGYECTDTDECADGTAMCDQVCVNERGGFRCECKEGYKLVGTRDYAICASIDYCEEDNGGCEQWCHSAHGQKNCSCEVGLRLADDGLACVDIDECSEDIADCEQRCDNRDPRLDEGLKWVCSCEEGFASNPLHPEQCVKETQFLKMLGQNELVQNGNPSWILIAGIIAASALIALLAGVAIHRWRTRHQMHSEIHEVMRQYMPLEGSNAPDGSRELLMREKDTIRASRPQDEEC